ncbi:uncharacterized protein LOC132193899 [Neocloeon triangulifer]|uniref:uncharacterized protein LOC132193899 n=1 Tax=Neocloeon triangulifer TaxID=2078957 RepID=UPI00286F7EA0|nr:uncharacterized protein LOC132193899 [Neocloeon triangulifer]
MYKKDFVLTLLILMLTIIICFNEVTAAKAKIHRARFHMARNPKQIRTSIIKCCGKNSCTKTSSKKDSTFGNKTETIIYTKSALDSDANDETSPIADIEEITTLSESGDGQTNTDAQTDNSPTENGATVAEVSQEQTTNFISTKSSSESSMESSLPGTTISSGTQFASGTQISTEMQTATTIKSAEVTSSSTTLTTLIAAVNLPNCNYSIQPEPNEFSNDGLLKNPDTRGFWMNSCDQQFLIGKTLVSWEENVAKCLKIGMEPVSLENDKKNECFQKLTSDWTGSTMFWTSGFGTSTSYYSWCTKNGTTVAESSSILWAAGQPRSARESENCVQLKILKANATYELSRRMCNETLFFACQGPPTAAPKCSAPTCPNITCQKNPYFYNNESNLKDPNFHGSWCSYKGRSYLFSYPNNTKTFLSAFQACCEIGMTLLSIEYDFKYNSLKYALTRNASYTADVFWTSGSDRGCEGKFGYCTAKRLLRQEAIWDFGQPDNSNGNENAVAVFINGSHALLSDFSEEQKFRYICEARETAYKKTGGNAIRDECAAAYNVTQKEIDTLMNDTSKFDLRIKCFLRCIGDSAGLMVNGKFIDGEVLATLEKMAKGNLKDLKKNTDILVGCQNSASGMDECDQAAQMIKCTNEKAPDVLNAVITTVDQSIPLPTSQNFPIAQCPNTPSCPINKTLQDEFLAAAGETNITNGNGFVRFHCGKKYLYYSQNVSLKSALDICCSYNLQLISVDSAEKADCLLTPINPVFAKIWSWTAGIRKNAQNPVWCTSNAPFSTASNFLDIRPTWEKSPSEDGISYKVFEKEISFCKIATNKKYFICEQK